MNTQTPNENYQTIKVNTLDMLAKKNKNDAARLKVG